MKRLVYYTSNSKHFIFVFSFIIEDNQTKLKIEVYEIINPPQYVIDVVIKSLSIDNKNEQIMNTINVSLRVINTYSVRNAINILTLMTNKRNENNYTVDYLIQFGNKNLTMQMSEVLFNWIYELFKYFTTNQNSIYTELVKKTSSVTSEQSDVHDINISFEMIFKLYPPKLRYVMLPFLNRVIPNPTETNDHIEYDSILNFDLIGFHKNKRIELYDAVNSINYVPLVNLIQGFLHLSKNKSRENYIKSCFLLLFMFFNILRHKEETKNKSMLILNENLSKLHSETMNSALKWFGSEKNIKFKNIRFKFNHEDSVIDDSSTLLKFVDFDKYVMNYDKEIMKLIGCVNFLNPEILDVSKLPTITEITPDENREKRLHHISQEIISRLSLDKSEMIQDVLYLYKTYISNANLTDLSDIKFLLYNVIISYLYKNNGTKYFFNNIG
jgi:hypothetical protein